MSRGAKRLGAQEMLAHHMGEITILSTVAAGGGGVLALGVALRAFAGPLLRREGRQR